MCLLSRKAERKINVLIDDCSSGKWATSSREKLRLCCQRSVLMAFKRETEATFSILKTDALWRKAGGRPQPALRGGCRPGGKKAIVLRWARLRLSCALSWRNDGDSGTGCFCIGWAPVPAREVFVLFVNLKKSMDRTEVPRNVILSLVWANEWSSLRNSVGNLETF